MGILTLQYGVLSYDDAGSSSPQKKNFDVSESFQQLKSSYENTARTERLAPGDSYTLASTLRSLAQDTTTVYDVERPVSTDGRMRLHRTAGTAPLFRTPRAVAGFSPSTSVSIVRIGPATCRLQLPGCTTSNVQVGDLVRFERNTDTFTSPFSAPNQSTSFVVQAVGSGTVDFLDNGAAALDSAVTGADQALSFLTPGPVRVGDTLKVAGSMNLSNQGEFQIIDVSDSYVEFVNTNGVVESFTLNAPNTVKIYDHKINFMHITASAPVLLALDGGTPFTLGSLGDSGPIVFLGSCHATQVVVTNNGTDAVSVTLRHAAVG